MSRCKRSKKLEDISNNLDAIAADLAANAEKMEAIGAESDMISLEIDYLRWRRRFQHMSLADYLTRAAEGLLVTFPAILHDRILRVSVQIQTATGGCGAASGTTSSFMSQLASRVTGASVAAVAVAVPAAATVAPTMTRTAHSHASESPKAVSPKPSPARPVRFTVTNTTTQTQRQPRKQREETVFACVAPVATLVLTPTAPVAAAPATPAPPVVTNPAPSPISAAPLSGLQADPVAPTPAPQPMAKDAPAAVKPAPIPPTPVVVPVTPPTPAPPPTPLPAPVAPIAPTPVTGPPVTNPPAPPTPPPYVPVPLVQSDATAVTVTTASSSGFGDQLATTGQSEGDTVTYVVTSSAPSLAVSPDGAITTTGTLAAGTYTVSGKDSDTKGDSGTWTYSLTVTPVTIVQTAPTGTTTVDLSGTYTGQIPVTGAIGAVTFTELTNSGEMGLTVSASGVVTALEPLDSGAYSVSGTETDAYGDTGTWTFLVYVNAVESTPN